MRSSWWRVTQPAKASTRKCRAWGMAGGYMAQTRPSPTLSRGSTRLGRFLAPYGLLAPIGNVPPTECEQQYYLAQKAPVMTAGVN